MKYAIINADDFGLSPGVNEGIIKAHQDGILTSATILANMPAFEDAVQLAKSYPSLGVGLHLNIGHIGRWSRLSPLFQSRNLAGFHDCVSP